MTLQQAYKNPSSASISLDTIISYVVYLAGEQSPNLRGNQSRDVLRQILTLMWFPCHGNLFHGRLRISHAALAALRHLSRRWTGEMIDRLRVEGWITTEARRLPNGQQEITIFRPGKMLKWALVRLLKSKQRPQNRRANDASQKIPSKEEVAKNKARFGSLIEEVAKKLGMKT